MESIGVRAVIFDLGGVITSPPWPLLAEYAAEVGLPTDALKLSMVHGAPALAEAELGIISTTEFFKAVCGHLLDEYGIPADPERIAGCIRDSLTPLPEMVELIGQVGEQHQTAILTNNTRDLAEVWRPRLAQDLVDVIVDSWEVGLRKPEVDIYLLVLDRLDCTPAQVVFVDDHPDNVATARELGMRAVLFEGVEQLRRALADCGVAMAPPTSAWR